MPWLFAHTMFPSLNILQHYAKFDNCTTIMLKKLLGVKSFSDFIGHLTYHQTTLLVFLGGLGVLSVIRTIGPPYFDMLGTDRSYTCHSFPTR